MEHRWGQRIPVKIPLRLIPESGEPVIGETENISLSGALVQTARSVRLFARLQVEVILGGTAERAAAYVTRKTRDGAAIEWCDFAPRAVHALLLAWDPLAALAASDEERTIVGRIVAGKYARAAVAAMTAVLPSLLAASR